MSALGDRGPLLIVGGGIAGAYLAALLGSRGQQVMVFDSRRDPRADDGVGGRSINLAIAERGLAALRRIGLVETVESLAVVMHGRVVHDADRSGVSGMQPYGNLPDEVLWSVDRTAFTCALLDAAEATGNVQTYFRQRCRDIDFDLGLATFADGAQQDLWHQVPFGTVFGADGVASIVRAEVLAVNGGSVRREMLSHRYIEIEIPATTSGGFQIAANGLHIWPRNEFMLIGLPNPTGDFTATLFLEAKGPAPSFEAISAPAEISAFFEEYFPSVVELVPDIVEQYLDAPLGRLGTIRTTGWSYEDRAVLVGDSAHGIVPFHGQGMNLALESASALVDAIESHDDDLAPAFCAFEADRRDDADAIADMAIQNYVEMRDKVNDPDYLLKRQLALRLSDELPAFFRPRYNLVMFSSMPYADAFARGDAQDALLAELVAGCASLDNVDMGTAHERVRALGPLVTRPG